MQNCFLYFRSRLLGTLVDVQLFILSNSFLEALKLYLFQEENIRYSWRCSYSFYQPIPQL
jgi:hypothetical protein